MNNPIDKLSLQNQLNKPKKMEQTNKLPSRFQIGDEVMYKEKKFKVISVEFTESKVFYGLGIGDRHCMYVDSIDVSPVEKQELSDTIIK